MSKLWVERMHHSMRKYLILAFVLTLVIMIAQRVFPTGAAVSKYYKVKLIVDDGTGWQGRHELLVHSNLTALDVLEREYEVKTKYVEGKGLFVVGIKTNKWVEEKDPYFWHFCVNGKLMEVGADSYLVGDGDNLTFAYSDIATCLR
ncbi:MAG: DUF4430 domain-containing protein [Nanoarchaeota archaeon]|nr:DUF4430 domain-containing protein [Nanoarchaeota archaeon]